MTARQELMEFIGGIVARERIRGGLGALTEIEAALLTTVAAMAHGHCRGNGIDPRLPQARAGFLRACEAAWDEMAALGPSSAMERGVH